MKKVIQWFAGFMQDQGKSASSKRLVLYIFVYIYYLQVNASLAGVILDKTLIYATIGVILFGIGAVTSEFFKDYIK